jgi:hypothetical protein
MCPVPDCQYGAARSWHVKRHMKRKHGDQAADFETQAEPTAKRQKAAAGRQPVEGAADTTAAVQGVNSQKFGDNVATRVSVPQAAAFTDGTKFAAAVAPATAAPVGAPEPGRATA